MTVDPSPSVTPIVTYVDYKAGERRANSLNPAERLGLLAIGFFISVNAVGLAVHAASVVLVVYTPLAILIALLLFFVQPSLYVGFAWWILFLSPFVRRLVDYQLGFRSNNPILLAPLVVTGLSLLSVSYHAPKLLRRTLYPFLLVLVALAYGFVVGIAHVGILAAGYGLTTWLAPVTFGIYLALHPEWYSDMRRMLARVFISSLLILGVYGVWQFVSPPPWDVYWITASLQSNALNPEPFKVRLFGTLNSFGPFAAVLTAGLLVTFAWPSQVWKRCLAAVPGAASLMMTQVRTAWGELALGLGLYLLYLPGRRRLAPIAILLLSFVILVLSNIQPFASVLVSRAGSIASLTTDGSYLARRQLFAEYNDRILESPLGMGTGATGMAWVLTGGNGSTAPIENGFQDVFYSLGWMGGTLYLCAVLILARRSLKREERNTDLFAKVARAITIATLLAAWFGNIFTAVAGTVLWTFLGMQVASRLRRFGTDNWHSLT